MKRILVLSCGFAFSIAAACNTDLNGVTSALQPSSEGSVDSEEFNNLQEGDWPVTWDFGDGESDLSEIDGKTQPLSAVNAQFDSRQIRRIYVNGMNILTFNPYSGGGGIYLIGSASGDDRPSSNYESTGSQNGRMTNGGPKFVLTFSPTTTPNVLAFSAKVGPVENNINSLTLAMDFDPHLMDSWKFNGSRHRYTPCTGSTSWRNKSSGKFNDIPQGCEITDNGVVLGHAGETQTDGLPSWARVSGSVAKVQIDLQGTIPNTTGPRNVGFTNHSGTHNMSINFGKVLKDTTVSIVGQITVTPNGSPFVRFQSERDFVHLIGRAEADGWAVKVGDVPNWASIGPLTAIGVRPVFSGNRTATWRLMLDNVTADNLEILKIDVFDWTANGKVLVSRQLRRKEFANPFAYQDFTLAFNAPADHELEFRTYYVKAVSYVRQDKVTVR